MYRKNRELKDRKNKKAVFLFVVVVYFFIDCHSLAVS
jgi:hypothetical protein